MRVFLCLCALLFLGGRASAQLPVYDAPRGWKTVDGQAFQATLTAFDGTTVVLRLSNGQRWQTPAAKLSPEDLAYLVAWQKKQPINITMPETVGVDSATMKVEIVSEDPANEKFVYRTEHFELESQGKFTQALLREVGRNFEATYELLKALPWGISPAPEGDGYFKAKLLRTRDAYTAEGGPENSGGVYMRSKGLFLVPFSSIGLKVVGKSYAKDDNFDTQTLVHELTHQMMHNWLALLPPWVIEGTAEYTGILPLKSGRFRVSAAKTGLKDYLDQLKRSRGGVPDPYPLEELFTITPKKWFEALTTDPQMSGRLYFTSYLLVYYFMHLDGKGDRQLFIKYFREVDVVRKEVEAYELALAEFKKLPGVEVLPDGSYRWTGDLKAPQAPSVYTSAEALDEYQHRTLQILLNGRTEAELMKEIRAAYARLGIRL